MRSQEQYNILNQRKLVSHIAFIIFSLFSSFVLPLAGIAGSTPFSIELFLMLFIQLEVFIFLGNLLFASVNFEKNPGDVTRIVMVRFLVFIAGCLAVSLILFILLQFAVSLRRGGAISGVIDNFFHKEIFGWFRSTVTGLTLGAIIFIFLLWQMSMKREQTLRVQNLIFQNETLKSQVNPHFLFNCLNTISSLLRSQPETAELFINDLSSVYRYILENGQKDKVPLKAELNFINDYFNLHRIRDDGKILLSINIPDDPAYEILPVSLQILLENAIKHNLATRDNPLSIVLFIENESVVFSNNLQRKATQLKSTGIGLKNLAERIRLTTDRELIVEESETDFIVKIPLLS
jgi:hypothetical protein